LDDRELSRDFNLKPHTARRRSGNIASLLFIVCGRHGKLRIFFRQEFFRVNDDGFKVWMCIICGWIYEEEKGAPEEGLAPGTRWEDVPEFWVCPDCGASKEDFEMIEL